MRWLKPVYNCGGILGYYTHYCQENFRFLFFGFRMIYYSYASSTIKTIERTSRFFALSNRIDDMTQKARMQNEIIPMQVRMFRLAQKRWKTSIERCAQIFDDMKIDQYIEDLYELFHVQGDDANLEEINDYLKRNGVKP